MSTQSPVRVYVRWEKETPIRVRLFKGGAKMDLVKGDMHEMDAAIALKLVQKFKGFSVVPLSEVANKDFKAPEKEVDAEAPKKRGRPSK